MKLFVVFGGELLISIFNRFTYRYLANNFML